MLPLAQEHHSRRAKLQCIPLRTRTLTILRSQPKAYNSSTSIAISSCRANCTRVTRTGLINCAIMSGPETGLAVR